eukprot:TRINITY_DN9904_c0_g1_i3.p1 TRINITY_DN9904_c0_g1~~TRINITY_DN9904_c0_g1_i3.p1  ORF type:complete len:107 (-),score=14.64 TRINITY_DN9904_c0_g1_i3:400-720(-)
MRPMTTKGKPESKAWTKAETGFLTTRRNPYHEMLIMAEKIHSERKLQDRPIKSRYSFNPHNSPFLLTLSLLHHRKAKRRDSRYLLRGYRRSSGRSEGNAEVDAWSA